MEEIWKDIYEYEDYYQVSNLGRVKSLVRKNCLTEKILKYNLDKDGYGFINLYKESKRKSVRIHRLVAEAFIPNSYNKPQVNHIDGIKTNNRVDNLEWNTAKENIKHSFKLGLSNNTGIKNSQAKLTEQQVLEIKLSNQTQTILAKKYNVCRALIGLIKNNKRWSHI